jgi:hypothetical protein
MESDNCSKVALTYPLNLIGYYSNLRHVVAYLFETHCYKQEGRGLDSR